jgi:hypothetical protein
MNKIIKLVLLAIILAAPMAFSQAVSIFYGLHLPDIGMSNPSLYPHFVGIDGYVATQWGQRVGWRGIVLYSTAQPARGVFGILNAGLLIGQQVLLGPIVIAVNCAGGIGISISDLGSSAEHLTYYGEATFETGASVGQGVSITAYFGIQTFGNLFPGIPGTEFLFYAPIAGLKFTMS